MARSRIALSVLSALLASAAVARAQTSQGDQLSLNLRLILQTRVTSVLDSLDAEGNPYDPLRGTPGDPEPARFDLRPIRVGMLLKYGEHWRSFIFFRSERLDLNNPAVFNRLMHLYIGSVEYGFKTDSIEHTIHFGLDKAWNNESSIPTFSNLFPTDRLVAARIEVRNSGVGYILRAPYFNAGFDVQANNTIIKDSQAANLSGAEATNGLFYSARVEATPKPEWMIAKKWESYAGAEGTGLLFGFDMQFNHKNLEDDGSEETFTQTDTMTFGPDFLIHWNLLTAIAEFRWRNAWIDTVTDLSGSSDSSFRKAILWDVQVAYAIPSAWLAVPVKSLVVEPALGLAYYDSDTDVHARPVYGNGTDNGPDGSTINAGVNAYFAGHNSKLQLAFQRWRAEGGQARNNAIRAQFQLSF
jgi:hypothetical protein